MAVLVYWVNFPDLETKVKGITLSNRGIKDVVYKTICP